jgi:gluconate 5-dehydrogenase
MTMFSLKGRVALVTGSSRGLGFAMAEALGKAGAKIVLNGRDKAALDERAKTLKAGGIDTTIAAFDVTDEKAVVDSIAKIGRDHGSLDILIANAGINVRKPVLDYATADFNTVIATNLTACFVAAREAGKIMAAKKHGRIIMTTSIMGRLARPTVPAYAAAKAGLDSLTRAMAVELAPKGVTVNAIAPGFFMTEMNTILVNNPDFDAMVKRRTPMARWAQPHELGGAAVFLASDEASYVSGHTLVVDGALTAAL